ncbi:hypothetical protein tb265_23090 [Gemmatimonadetes bacterium T265]|nr:hypothetical protein tb265_23090 [Gemmatimonadetes bacterium T265]
MRDADLEPGEDVGRIEQATRGTVGGHTATYIDRRLPRNAEQGRGVGLGMSRRVGRSPDPHPGRARPPSERPTKTCARCGLPFTWRKKWARDWDEVRYCSARCRQGRASRASGGARPVPP